MENMKNHNNNYFTRRSLFIGSFLFFIGGCATLPSNRTVEFIPADTRSFGAVSRPAQISKESDDQLAGKGFARLGLLAIDQVVERCSSSESKKEKCEKISHNVNPNADLLQESARRGGELVTIMEDKKREEKATAGTRCTQMSTVRDYSSMVYFQGQYRPGTVTRSECSAWEKTLSREIHLVSSGVIWRLDPELAGKQRNMDKLVLAAFSGDMEGVRRMIEKGVSADSRDPSGIPALGWAAEGGNLAVVEYLLEKGARLDSGDFMTSPLNMAAAAGKEAIVRTLVKKGARIDSRDISGNTPLWNAAFNEQTGVVRILISAGADPNAGNSMGNTPLFAAITGSSPEKPKLELGGDLFAQDPEIVRLLLKAGADPKAVNKAKQTPAFFAEMMAPAGAAARFFVNYWYGATGYIDKTGKWIIKPQFHETGHFHEGLAKISIKGEIGGAQLRFGFIDRTGKIVIPVRFDAADPFSQGVAGVKFGGKWGYIDKSGNWVIQPKYESAYQFFYGLAPVQLGKDHWIFIDRQGRQALPEKYSKASSFSDGVAWVIIRDQSGFIDITGKWVLKTAPDKPHPFHFTEGLGLVSSGSMFDQNTRYGYMDKTGKMVIPQSFTKASDFQEGLASVVDMNSPHAKYIDRSGKIVLGEGWTIAGNFSDGWAHVVNKWGALTAHLGKREVAYIDKQGKTVLTLDYLSDPELEWASETIFDSTIFKKKRAVFATSFSEGLAAVRVLRDKFLSIWEKSE
jgi:ankyrin repeat protein